MQIDTPNWERMLDVIQSARAVNRHVDFFMWLQTGVAQFLPHDVLIAVWGDFERRRLHYDLASRVPELHTQRFTSRRDLDTLMIDLHRRWLSLGERSFVVNDFRVSGISAQAGDAAVRRIREVRSVVVHGIRDRRELHDCLYVFLDRSPSSVVHHATVELLVPHIDATLRRIDQPGTVGDQHSEVLRVGREAISEREQEIMRWVKNGKTNEEIAMLLRISPNTVKNHLKRIFQKLDVSSRAQAVAKYAVTG